MATRNFNKQMDKMIACPCCGEGDLPPIMYVILEHLKSHFNNRPVIINSGCRCWSHNEKVGGSENSQHLIREIFDLNKSYSLAVDIRVSGLHPMTVYQYLDQLPYAHLLGLGYYEPEGDSLGWVHLDVRGDWLGGERPAARWGA